MSELQQLYANAMLNIKNDGADEKYGIVAFVRFVDGTQEIKSVTGPPGVNQSAQLPLKQGSLVQSYTIACEYDGTKWPAVG